MEDIQKQRDALQSHYDELTDSLQRLREKQTEKVYLDGEVKREEFAAMSVQEQKAELLEISMKTTEVLGGVSAPK